VKPELTCDNDEDTRFRELELRECIVVHGKAHQLTLLVSKSLLFPQAALRNMLKVWCRVEVTLAEVGVSAGDKNGESTNDLIPKIPRCG